MSVRLDSDIGSEYKDGGSTRLSQHADSPPTLVLDLNSTFTLSNGVKIPMLGLGTFKARKEEAYKIVTHALHFGYRLIDTAKVYKNESIIGRAIKDSEIPRSNLFITSKLSPAEHGFINATEACLESIEELGLDYLDLYLIHWPAAQGLPKTSSQNAVKRKESWKALEELHKIGKVKAIGVSNYTISHLKELMEYAEIMPHVNQVEYHPNCQQPELAEFCKMHNILLQPYSPFGQGRLFETEEVLRLARKRNKAPGQILIRWALQHNMGSIPKTIKTNHLEENMDVFDWELSPGDMSVLDALDCNAHFCWDPSDIP